MLHLSERAKGALQSLLAEPSARGKLPRIVIDDYS